MIKYHSLFWPLINKIFHSQLFPQSSLNSICVIHILMQLNSLTLNSSSSATAPQSQLAIYDHNLVIVNSQLFVYGKNIQNFNVQTPLHKINLFTFKVEPVLTVNAPIFSQPMMFNLEQRLFLWGKTAPSQDNELYEFDGLKFTKMNQTGPVPSLNGHYSFTKFSDRYLLLFKCLNEIKFQNKWYLFDIKLRQWKQIISAVQIPLAEKSHLLWKNGRGYLLLQNCYNKTTQRFFKNLFYQIKFTNLSQSIVQLMQIPLPSHIKELNIVFTQIFSVDEKRLIMMGGQQNCVSQKQKQKQTQFQIQLETNVSKIDFKNTKIMLEFDLESFQWNSFPKTLPLKGQHHKIFAFNAKLYTIGGAIGNHFLKEIQVFDLNNWQNAKKFIYEQSLCYYCECAFTYQQNLIYEPAIDRENETFALRNRVENTFLRRFSQSITTELHAIGILCEFLIDLRSYQIQINLSEQIKLQPRQLTVKQKIQNQVSEILAINSLSNQFLSLNQLIQSATGDENPLEQNNLSINLTKIKLASFKLGYALLCVASTQQGHIFVSYSSYSQTDFPQSNFKSFSQIFYTVKWNKKLKKYECSSENKKEIIFQNVKMHFGSPSVYDRIQFEGKKTKFHPFFNIYVIGINNLGKVLCIEPPKSKFIEDINIKSLSKKNVTNSLRKYLKHFYLTSSLGFKWTLQNVVVDFVNVYEKFQQLAKIVEIKEIPTNDETEIKKAENEQTHFSTNHDEVISWKKIQMIDRCKIYEVQRNDLNLLTDLYSNVFVYHSKKLLQMMKTKNSMICGVIQLKQQVEIQLNGGSFAQKTDERMLMRWMNQIQNGIIEERSSRIYEI